MQVKSFEDLALGKKASQSSICQWSLGRTTAEDAAVPVSSCPGPGAYCHTDFEQEPWWQVDLGADCRIHEIRLMNRADEPQRMRRFSVLVSNGRTADWTEVFRKDDDRDVSPDEPFVIRPPAPCVGRFVRVRLNCRGYLHIRQFQVIGRELQHGERQSAEAKMREALDQAAAARERLLAELGSGRSGQVVAIGRHQVFVDVAKYSPKLVHALTSGGYEWRERQLLPQILNSGDRVLEVGTAIGAVTMAAAEIVGPEAVTTYDANPDIVADARRNFAFNGLDAISANVGVMRNRRSWVPEEVETSFYVSHDFWASRLEPGPTTADIARVVTVPFVCLEDVIGAHQANVLVCDIEGGEGDLLTGADLTAIRAILMETHYWSIGRKRTDEMVRYLVSVGFDINLDLIGNHVMVLERPQ